MNGDRVPFVTVTELNNYLKELVFQDLFLQNLWVKGEISNYKAHSSGHIYFTLKDEKGILRCVFFRGKQRRSYTELSDGKKVLVRGNISIYEKLGQHQLYVEEVQLDGVGDLYQAYQHLKEKLSRQGLFDKKHKKPLPYLPKKIAVVTSLTGAALRDFLKTLEKRYPQLYVLIVPVAVQGEEAPAQIKEALHYINQDASFDITVIARGGGSLEELWAFNTEEVAEAIFTMNSPVVSAVGHETDFTIADFVADVRVSTPTAAAETIVPSKEELSQNISQLLNRVHKAQNNIIKYSRSTLDRYKPDKYYSFFMDKIKREKQYIDELETRLVQVIKANMREKKNEINASYQHLTSLNPEKVLDRGFIYALTDKGKPVTKISDIGVGERLHLAMKDGKLITRVEDILGRDKDYE